MAGTAGDELPRSTGWTVRLLVTAALLGLVSTAAQLVAEASGWIFHASAFYRRALLAPPFVFLVYGALALSILAGACALAAVLGRRLSGRPARGLEALPSAGLRELLGEVRGRTLEAVAGPEPDVGLAIDELLRGAHLLEASDLHLSPSQGELSVTYRVHGALHEVVRLPGELGPRFAIRVKVLARMDTYARKPQDGRLLHKVGEVALQARVSSLPADFGERLVLRLVRGAAQIPRLDQLGLDSGLERRLVDLLSRPQGLLFVSGPVGSGKTTSLYASLHHIVESRGNLTSLVTLEDPIELQLPFATQTQINTHMGMSFAQTLRSVLRQDPNVLMVGEIRDRETAEIAVQAGLTGHLILTTIHVESAAGTFARMIDMGIDPFTVASATVGCLSQRLVRVLCTHCRSAQAPEPLLVSRFRQLGIELPDAHFYEPAGCEFCEGAGYVGRQPVAELLVMSSTLRAAVHQRASTLEVLTIARAEGLVPLLDSALARAVEGVTSLSEVLRVAG